MSAITLYEHPLSGNCYKVRLLLALLGLDYQSEQVDILKGASQTAEFKQMNPRGQIPVLRDGEALIWDSMAILVYLARRYGGDAWRPSDALGEAQVMQWLALSENELLYGLARARAVKVLGRPFDLAQCQAEGHAGLGVLEGRLQESEWLIGERPTIADIACYPYVRLAPMGEVSLEGYPAVRSWMARLEALPAFVPFD